MEIMKKLLQFSVIVAIGASACSDEITAVDVPSLQIVDVVVGTGAVAEVGKTVTVHYTGWLYEESGPGHHGVKFDSSRDRNSPFAFELGAGDVIEGWDQGVAGMKVGGKRTLIIPSSLAYGPYGNGSIPPNAALVFDIELLNVQ
jgi:FKBP-type peptidyl-prolyl cis-trans isomerase FkpA